MKIIKSEEFEMETKKGTSVIDFFATWCGPCRMMAPIFESVGQKMSGKANFVKVDVDESEDLARKFGVMSIPTMVILKDGNLVAKRVGLMQADALEQWVNENLY